MSHKFTQLLQFILLLNCFVFFRDCILLLLIFISLFFDKHIYMNILYIELQVKNARIRLSQFDSTMISDIRLRQATNQLLTREAEVVEEMVLEGLLSEQNAEEVRSSFIILSKLREIMKLFSNFFIVLYFLRVFFIYILYIYSSFLFYINTFVIDDSFSKKSRTT